MESRVFLLCVIAVFGYVACSPMSYDTIVVGLGAAGTAAATTLAKAGKRVLALEAQNRVGGRVRTVPFGDGVVELGAEWIHGTQNSRTYDLATQRNVSLLPQDLDFDVFRSDGSEADTALINDLVNYCLETVENPPEKPEPSGQYISRKLKEYVKARHPQIDVNGELIKEFLLFMDLVIDNYESSDSWNDVTTHTNYEELDGNQHMSWHKNGYKTLFEILLNTYKKGPGIPNLDMRFNTEVTHISWSPAGASDVTVTCKNGDMYRAAHVIFTGSLGVLKERYNTLFTPGLPHNKTEAIKTTSIGVVAKVIFNFATVPWPAASMSGFSFIWRTDDRSQLADDDHWLTKAEAADVPMGCKTCLTVWFNGEGARTVETLPEEVVKRKVMEVIRRFMGKKYNIPEPIDMIRSTWYSNPFTRGSYSYDNLDSPNHPNARSTLAAPLLDAANVPRVLFAGEATENKHFSTVHGALETGYREAARLLQPQSKL